MVCSTGFGFILKSHIFMMKELILLKGKCTNSPRNAAKSTTSHITASQIFFSYVRRSRKKINEVCGITSQIFPRMWGKLEKKNDVCCIIFLRFFLVCVKK